MLCRTSQESGANNRAVGCACAWATLNFDHFADTQKLPGSDRQGNQTHTELTLGTPEDDQLQVVQVQMLTLGCIGRPGLEAIPILLACQCMDPTTRSHLANAVD